MNKESTPFRNEPLLEIRTTDSPPEGWDEYVRSAQGGSFCHLGGWGRVFRKSLGLKARFLSAWGNEGILGVLPLYEMPRLGPGRVLVSVPFLNYGGPLGEEAVRRKLVSEATREASRTGAKLLELRNRSALEGALEPGRQKVTVTLDLPDDPEVLFKEGFKAKLRSQIRRPQKEGMEVRFGLDQGETFYRVFSRNMRDLGTPVLPRTLFDGIAEAFPREADFGVVYHQDQPVAAGAGFHFRGEFEMTWASSLREYNRQAPNMLLYWAFMERCIEKGYDVFNFGRCTPGGGTHRFKKQWGGVEEPLPWIQWPAPDQGEASEKGIFQQAIRIWQKLPVPVANTLGPHLARRIPTF